MLFEVDRFALAVGGCGRCEFLFRCLCVPGQHAGRVVALTIPAGRRDEGREGGGGECIYENSLTQLL